MEEAISSFLFPSPPLMEETLFHKRAVVNQMVQIRLLNKHHKLVVQLTTELS